MKKVFCILIVCTLLLSLSVPAMGAERVILLDGNYSGEAFQTLLDANGDNVIYRPAAGASVTVSGDLPLTNWVETTVNGVRCFETSAGGKTVTALFRGSEKLQSARLPENGYYYIKSVNTDDNLWTEETTLWADGTLGQRSFNADLADLSKAPVNMADVTVHIPHMWHDEVTGMSGFDPATGRVTMVKYAAMTICAGDRYCLENILDAMDKSGEWCFDSKADKIYYVPFETETTDNLSLTASCVTELLQLDGLSNITFEDIVFQNTGWDYARKAYCNIAKDNWTKDIDMDQPQGAIDAAGAIRLTDTENITFRNCEFVNIGTTALKMTDGVRNCTVENCRFERIGASAIYAGGQNNEAACAGNICVRNCLIGNYGLQFHSAPGILYSYVDGGQIEHNEIHDGYYTGISCGWVWLYGEHVTNHIQIRNNLIYNIGKRMLSDMGGIYMLGTQYGTEISGNVIHDVHCYDGSSGYAGTGIYTDAGASQMQIFNNLVFNCSTCGFNATIATDDCIYNNIAAFCGECVVDVGGWLANYESHLTYKNNIFLTDKKVPIFCYIREPGHFSADANILWDYTYGRELYFASRAADEDCLLRQQVVRKKFFENPIFADPLFRDAEHFDFTLCADSPAFAMGFTAWDYAEAGTQPGTRIGLSSEGGQTAYNESTSVCTMHAANLSTKTKICKWFYDLWDRITAFFMNLKGVRF